MDAQLPELLLEGVVAFPKELDGKDHAQDVINSVHEQAESICLKEAGEDLLDDVGVSQLEG